MSEAAIKLTSRKIIEAANRFAEAQSVIDELKPQLLEAMGDNRRAIAGNRIIKVSVTAATPAVPGYTISAEHIGTVVKAKPARGEQKRLTVE